MSFLNVFLGEQQVGVLSQDDAGELQFQYLPGATPISVSLPVREEPFEDGECYPFFEGILPEENQRRAIERAVHVSGANVLGMLEFLGGEVAGAVRLLREGEDPSELAPTVIPAALSDLELEGVLKRLPGRPMLVGEGQLRLSLAGAQTKLPVCLTNGCVRLPAPGEATTHIVKPPIPSYPGTTENEAFVMRLAAAVGLPTARVEARRLEGADGPKTYLLVERYDREYRGGRAVRLHQEDFCQALGFASRQKYETNLGPGIARCRQLIMDCSKQPALDTRHFLDVVGFNLLVGNGDAHAKNFSLLYTAEGIQMAPLYDLLSTALYPDLPLSMAMSIGGTYRFSEVDRVVLTEGARALGLRRDYLIRRLDFLRERLPKAAEEVATGLLGCGLDEAVLERLVRLVRDRSGELGRL